MNITVQCAKCAKRYAAPEKLAGRRVKCPVCGAAVDVPQATVSNPLADLLDEDLAGGAAIPNMATEQKTLAPLPQRPQRPATPAPGQYRPARSRNYSSGPNPDSTAVKVCVYLFMIPNGLILLVAWIALTFSSWSPLGSLILGAVFSVILLSVYGHSVCVGLAFSENVGKGLVSLFFWPYLIYYAATNWRVAKQPFLMWITPPAVGICLALVLPAVMATRNAQHAGSQPQSSRPASPYGRPPSMPSSHRRNINPPRVPSRPRAPSVPRFFYHSIPVPSFPARGTFRTLEQGVEFCQVDLNVRSGQPGHCDTLYVYLPSGEQKSRSISCVLIAAAGGTAFSGMKLDPGDRAEHIPYVKEGLAVVAYEVDGPLPDNPTDADRQAAYRKFSAAKAGLVNARNALEFVKARMPEVDPHHIYAAGHSSAGTLALLLTEYESAIRGCMAYAPVCNVEEDLDANLAALQETFPESETFFKSCSPHSLASRLRKPVFLFHARDDDVVSPSQTRDFSRMLSEATLLRVDHGGHHEAMINEGIPAAIEWLMRKGTISGGPPPIAKPPREWAYQPDGVPQSTVTLAPSPIDLQSNLMFLRRAVFTSAKTGQAIVLGHSIDRTFYLNRIDLLSGVSIGQFPLPGECDLADVTPDGTRVLVVANGHAEIWSTDTGRLIVDWQFSNEAAHRSNWAAFIDNQRVATLDHKSGHLAVWSLPDCHEVYSVDKVTSAAVSPQKKYVAIFGTFDRFWPGRLIDGATGELCGSLASPDRETEVRCCSFSQDGLRLAGGGFGGLAIWDLKTGDVDTEIPESISSKEMTFVSENYILAGEELFDTKRRSSVWEYDIEAGFANWDRTIGTPDGRAWLITATSPGNPAYLGPIELPTADVAARLANLPSRPGLRPGRSKITLQHLFGSRPVPRTARDRTPLRPGTGTRPMPSAPVAGVVSNPTFAKAATDYVRQAHVDLIVDDRGLVKDRLRWYTAAKRPTIGLRWGVGVTWLGGDAPQVRSAQQLASVTGPAGAAILTGLQKRINEGKFGDWPNSGDPRFRQVTLLGTGKYSDLIEAAKEQAIDNLIIVSILVRPVGGTGKSDAEMKIRLVDTAGELPKWTSPSLSNARIAAGKAAGEDPEAEFAEDVLAQIDKAYTLRPMPTLKPKHVEGRVAALEKRLFRAEKEELLHVLVELRYYQAMGLLPADKAAALLGNILSPSKAQTLAEADADQRREAVMEWLKSG